MTFYHPTCVGSTEDFEKISQNSSDSEFFVEDFCLDLTQTFEDSKFYYLFGFSSDVKICFQGKSVPGTIFDYYNPLLWRKSAQIDFYSRKSCQPLEKIFCRRMFSPIFDKLEKRFRERMIFYPPKYYIDYFGNYVQTGSYQSGLQFYEILFELTTNPQPRRIPSQNLTLNLGQLFRDFGLEIDQNEDNLTLEDLHPLQDLF